MERLNFSVEKFGLLSSLSPSRLALVTNPPPPFPPPFLPLPRNARIITHRCQNNLITSASTPMIDRVFHSLRTYPPPPLSSNDSTLLLPSLRAKLAEVRYFEQGIFPRRNVVDNVSFVRLGTSRGDEWNFYSGLGRNIYFLA